MRAFKIKITILCCLFFLLRENTYAQFFITPGQHQTVTDGCWGFPSDYSWSWDCSEITNTVDNENAQTFFIPLNVSCCTVKFTAHGKCNGFGQNFQQTFNILPVMNPGPSVVYPGDFFYITTSAGGLTSVTSTISNYPYCGGVGGLNCASDHGCPNANITWQVSGASGSPSPSGGSCNMVTVPTNPASVTSPIVINANYNCNTAHALGPVSVNVALHNPVITGSQSIGCTPQYYNTTGANTIIYSASNVTGAGYWNWQWPSGMTPTNPGNIHGQSISLDVISGSGAGFIKVQAFSTDGTVSSGLVSYPVNICCVPVVNEAITLNSGNAGYQKEAGSTINSTDNIQSSGTATLHAGAEVHLFPGFNAVQGSQVHLYNASCNTGYMRLMSTETTVDNTVSSGYVPVKNTGAAETQNSALSANNSKIQKKSNVGFNVMPNPSNGKFILTIKDNNELPSEISIIDGFGSIIQKVEMNQKNSCTLDLSNYADGVYTIRASYYGKVESKLVIKNSN